MTAIFWLVDQQTRIALLNYQWNNFKEKLEVPEPKQDPIINAPDYSELSELSAIKEMSIPPRHPRLVK
jgi:hypothetical protein